MLTEYVFRPIYKSLNGVLTRCIGKRRLFSVAALIWAATALAIGAPIKAQGSTGWENAFRPPMIPFTGPIWLVLSLSAAMIGGLMFALSEEDSERRRAGFVFFSVAMAVGVVNLMNWLMQ